jgi:hypothetical protein
LWTSPTSSLSWTYGRGLLKDARFLEAYRIREIIETNIYDSEGMLIFERTDH